MLNATELHVSQTVSIDTRHLGYVSLMEAV